ncbi:hypothetical protein BD413DRAFT_523673 [Trametes elegans]|nr:hypothetical protein BD413DRAFT_523673 [Trametes elegans]
MHIAALMSRLSYVSCSLYFAVRCFVVVPFVPCVVIVCSSPLFPVCTLSNLTNSHATHNVWTRELVDFLATSSWCSLLESEQCMCGGNLCGLGQLFGVSCTCFENTPLISCVSMGAL